MLPDPGALRARLAALVADLADQGHAVDGALQELEAAGDSYDALAAFAGRLAQVPLRDDWPYLEPDDLAGIADQSDPDRPLDALGALDPADAAARTEAAFLARVCGCMLGKPFEIDPTLEELRDALAPAGEWPLRDYPSEAAIARLRERQPQSDELARETIDHVVPDDDINYTIIGMLLLEAHGVGWTREHLRDTWLLQLPSRATFGPERTFLAASTVAMLEPGGAPGVAVNPGAELCGALIRADAYGYACLGWPARAAEMAWRDASITHRRTGVYAAMFVAAAIASIPFLEPLEAFEIALGYVPQRSRFVERARLALSDVAAAASWEDGYRRVHERFAAWTHCRVYQEIGTLANTLRFARDAGQGICLQVMQGNDTDSFGATAGSLLGARFGVIDERWWRPFRDDLRVALAMFHERSLAAVAARMGALPALGAAAQPMTAG